MGSWLVEVDSITEAEHHQEHNNDPSIQGKGHTEELPNKKLRFYNLFILLPFDTI